MTQTDFSYDWPLILAYHSVSERRTDSLAVRVSDFEYQMAWLRRNGYKSMTLAEFTSQPVPKGERIVIITFDDGYTDNYMLAFPILKQFGFVATCFLVSDYVDTDNVHWWDQPKITPQLDEQLYRLLSWEQIYEMTEYGIEFGSHTCTHPLLTDLSPDQCWEEINRSRTDLETKLQSKVVSFCYPAGSLNQSIIEMVEQAGYEAAVVTPPRSGYPLCHYTLRRIGIYHQNTPFIFRLKTRPLFRRNYERSLLKQGFRAIRSLSGKR